MVSPRPSPPAEKRCPESGLAVSEVLAVLGEVGDERALPLLFDALPYSLADLYWEQWRPVPVAIAAIVARFPAPTGEVLRRECDGPLVHDFVRLQSLLSQKGIRDPELRFPFQLPVRAFLALSSLCQQRDPEAPRILRELLDVLREEAGVSELLTLVSLFQPQEAAPLLLSLVNAPSDRGDLNAMKESLRSLLEQHGRSLGPDVLAQIGTLPDRVGDDWRPPEPPPAPGEQPLELEFPPPFIRGPGGGPLIQDWRVDFEGEREAAAAELRHRGLAVPPRPVEPQP